MKRREFLSFAAAGPLLLADQHKTNYTICLSRDSSLSEQRGARELQNYVEQMCGTRLPIVTDEEKPSGPLLLVGRSDILERIDDTIPFDELGDEGFSLKTSNPHVIIAGGRLRGTMYGVSAFLEKLGCRWYAPDCTYVPKMQALRVPALNETQKPAFEYREVFIEEAETNKDWAARNRTNGNFSQLDKSTGGKFTFYPFSSDFYKIIPPDRYFASHPEYFSLVDGKRTDIKAQLCLSNPDVLRIATETVLRWAAEHPEVNVLSVSENDADGPCECRNCRRIEEEEGGAHSGPIIRFVNAIAAQVAKKYPKLLISTLAYRYSVEPPTKTRPAPNVRVFLALSGACNGHPYEQCPYNKYSMGILRSWARITHQLYVWHYMTDFHQMLLPYPNLDELSADMEMYHRHGVIGLFLQGSYPKGGGGELAEMRSYLCAKLLWNPKLSGPAIMKEFLRAYYGPAAPMLERYIDRTHHAVRLPPRGHGQQIYMYSTADFTPEFLPEAHRLFYQMKKVTQEPALHKEARRVRKEELSIDSIELLNAKRFVLKDGYYGPADLKDFWAKYDRFSRKLQELGIIEIYENVPLTVQDKEYRQYVKSYRTTVIENPSLRVTAAAGFQGRVVSIVNKKTGQNAVRMSVPDTRFNSLEVLGGMVLLAHPNFYSRESYPTEWTATPNAGPREMVLEGLCSNGLHLHRSLAVPEDGPVLHSTTTVSNHAKEPLTVTLESRVQINPGDKQHPTVKFFYLRRTGGRYEEQVLPPPGMNFGDEFFHGSERPAGEWGLINSSRRITLINRFTDDQVERCRFWWRGRCRNTVALSSWSPKRTLAPGESLTFKTDYVAE